MSSKPLALPIIHQGTCKYPLSLSFSAMLIVFIPVSSTLDGQCVSGQDYSRCLSELVNICVLCNDSGLAYNEVDKWRENNGGCVHTSSLPSGEAGV